MDKLKTLRDFYSEHVKDKGRELPFRILLSFLITFIVARLMVYSIINGILPNMFLIVDGTHVHHLNYGIFLLSISGYFALTLSKNEKWIKKIAIIYGIGLGLTFDEFGMWLHLRDDYWMRHSYDAVIVVAILLFNGLVFGRFWMNYCSHCIKSMIKKENE